MEWSSVGWGLIKEIIGFVRYILHGDQVNRSIQVPCPGCKQGFDRHSQTFRDSRIMKVL